MAGHAELWSLIHAERAALISDLRALTDEQWSTPSLCAGWSVREVLAHMTATARMTPPRFISRFAATGFRFNVMNSRGVAAEVSNNPATAMSRFEALKDATSSPPGPLQAMVGEVVIHSSDIRTPLEIAHTFSPEILQVVGDFVIRGNLLLGGKRRAQGLTLRASDVDWTKGTGPEVSGPMVSLIQALTGRGAGLTSLSGAGLATLTARV